MTIDTNVTPDLGKTGALTYRVADRKYHGDQGQTVTVQTRHNAAGVVAAYDSRMHQRGLALSVHVQGVQDQPVTVSYTSTAVTELLLTPPFLNAHPIAIMVLRHAALSSKHVPTLAVLLRAHAARDPAYLLHPTKAELAELSKIAADVQAKLAAELRTLRAHAKTPTPTHSTHSLLAPFSAALPAGCRPALKAYSADASGVCYAAKTKIDSKGDIRLKATNNGPSWSMLFSKSQTIAPLAIVPPHTISVPGLSAILSALSSVGLQALKGIGCKIIGAKCGIDVLKPLKQLLSNLNSDGTASLTVPANLTSKPAFNVEAGGRTGGIEQVPQSGHAATEIEVWHKAAYVLTLWTQLISPLISLLKMNQDEPEGPPEKLTTKQARKKAFKTLAGTIATGPLKSDLPSLINDMRAGAIKNSMMDTLKLVKDITTSPQVLKAVLDLWGVDLDEKFKEKVVEFIAEQGAKLIPGIGWLKALIDATDEAAALANVGFGLYALTGKLPGYDTYVSYQPLRSANPSPTTAKPPPAPTTGDTGTSGSTTTYPPHLSWWTNKPFTIKTDAKGHVTVTWRIMRWCRDVGNKPPCDKMNGQYIVPGGKARGTLTWHSKQAATGMITSSAQPSRVPTGMLTITPAGKNAINAKIGSTSLTATPQTSGPMWKDCGPGVPSHPHC